MIISFRHLSLKQSFKVTLIAVFCFYFSGAIGQTADGVGIGTLDVNPDAILELDDPNNRKGLLIPRMGTLDRTSNWVSSPGILVYDTDIKSLYYYDGATWHSVGSPAGTIVMWSGTLIPQGWGLCNGNWYDPDDNTNTGTTSSLDRTIRTPDLSGRFIVGYDADIAVMITRDHTVLEEQPTEIQEDGRQLP